MGEKEQVIQELRRVFSQLKKEIQINNNEFDQQFENIIKLFEKEKMEKDKISLKEEQDSFIDYYNTKHRLPRGYIEECLKDANYDYKNTIDKMDLDEDEDKKSSED